MTKNRLETICDGIFAIVMTLLILDVKLPPKIHFTDSKELFDNLLLLKPKIIAFSGSFFIISTFLSGHHFILSLVKKIDNVFLWINLLYLMVITFIPFPTSILAEYSDNYTALLLYGLNVMLAGVFHTLMVWFIYKNDDLRVDTISKMIAKKYFTTSLWGTLAGFIALFLGLFNIYIGQIMLIFIPIYFIFERIRNEKVSLKKAKKEYDAISSFS